MTSHPGAAASGCDTPGLVPGTGPALWTVSGGTGAAASPRIQRDVPTYSGSDITGCRTSGPAVVADRGGPANTWPASIRGWASHSSGAAAQALWCRNWTVDLVRWPTLVGGVPRTGGGGGWRNVCVCVCVCVCLCMYAIMWVFLLSPHHMMKRCIIQGVSENTDTFVLGFWGT